MTLRKKIEEKIDSHQRKVKCGKDIFIYGACMFSDWTSYSMERDDLNKEICSLIKERLEFIQKNGRYTTRIHQLIKELKENNKG